MYYLKTKFFARWAKNEGLSDSSLLEAVREFESGLFEVGLGNHLFKKRIALAGKGKSGGARTILFYQKDKKLIFCLGFNKNQKDNLSHGENKVMHKLSDAFHSLTEEALLQAIKHNEFIRIIGTEAQS